MSCCSHSYYAAPPCGHAWSCKRSSICRCKLANASTCICSRQLLILNLAGFHRAYRNERTLPCQIHCVVTQDAEVSTLPRIEVLLQLDTVGLATVISLRSYNIFEQLMYLFPWTCVVPCMSDWTCSHCPPLSLQQNEGWNTQKWAQQPTLVLLSWKMASVILTWCIRISSEWTVLLFEFLQVFLV